MSDEDMTPRSVSTGGKDYARPGPGQPQANPPAGNHWPGTPAPMAPRTTNGPDPRAGSGRSRDKARGGGRYPDGTNYATVRRRGSADLAALVGPPLAPVAAAP